MVLFIDIETRAATDLRKSNVYRYVEDPTFEILMCAWAVDDRPVRLAIGERSILTAIKDHVICEPIIAHNATFERVCISKASNTAIPPEWFIDTQALAAEAGLPQSLGKLAKALGVAEKDSAGTRLINTFSKPTKSRFIRPDEKPEAWDDFCNYCVQDVETLREVYRALPGFPTETERRLHYVDQRINDRGMRIDTDLAAAATRVGKRNTERARSEVTEITGVSNPNSVQQLSAWFADTGLPVSDLRAETVEDLLAQDGIATDHRRVLALRQELALSSAKKFEAALLNVCQDGRLRGSFRFHGAHTGRWSGRGVQPQNLPRADLGVYQPTLDCVVNGAEVDPQTLKALVRSLFLGPLTVVDYSAIEARVLAWLADEMWVLDAFRAGRDIYVETATRMGGLSRQQGKVAVLACGYGGAVGALRKIGGLDGSDDELRELAGQYRSANPRIVRLWRRLESAFGSHTGGRVGRMRFTRKGRDVTLHLPSGRRMVYHDVRYYDDRLSFADPRGYRVDTYGGRLAENVTQAVARDLLADALIRADDAGLPVVGHVHDEVIVEGDCLEKLTAIMCDGPAWADGLPLAAEGSVMARYSKA